MRLIGRESPDALSAGPARSVQRGRPEDGVLGQASVCCRFEVSRCPLLQNRGELCLARLRLSRGLATAKRLRARSCCRVSREVSVFSSLVAGVAKVLSWVSESNKQKNCEGGKKDKKESPVEVSTKAYVSSIPEERVKSQGSAAVVPPYLTLCLSNEFVVYT